MNPEGAGKPESLVVSASDALGAETQAAFRFFFCHFSAEDRFGNQRPNLSGEKTGDVSFWGNSGWGNSGWGNSGWGNSGGILRLDGLQPVTALDERVQDSFGERFASHARHFVRQGFHLRVPESQGHD